VKEQMASFRSYAVMADWTGKWTTMNHSYEIRQLGLFQALVRMGLIYRKRKPVYWSPSSRTALAEAELEYKEDHVSHAAYVRFPTSLAHDRGGKVYAMVWTTTPWTLPANQAIGVHKDLYYSLVKMGSDWLMIATNRLHSTDIQALLPPNPEILRDEFKGSDLQNITYINKLRGHKSSPLPVIHADFVSDESGTGLVHLAPGHGHEDYEVCDPLGIEALAPITDHGHFTQDAYPDDFERLAKAGSIFGGGSREVIKVLGDDVLAVKRHKHKYPYDWRTKQPVVVRATHQWFCNVGEIKQWALEALKSVHFIPESSRTRLVEFIKSRDEWCISRQRAWGVPIPAIYDQDGNAVMTPESVGHIMAIMEERGTSRWFSDAPDDPAWILSTLHGKYTRGTDTMDVWFDSGSSWQETEGQADVYLEGTDQHRGWFQSSLLTWIPMSRQTEQASKNPESWTPTAPFKTLITHGFTLDEDGKKMSKSLGNVITPDEIMNGTLMASRSKPGRKDNRNKGPDAGPGPDALRLWVASSDYTKDIVISPQVIGNVTTTLQKYRSMVKMFLGSMAEDVPRRDLTKLDAIAVCQLLDVQKEIEAALRGYEFYKAVSALNRWIINDVSAFYLEALKDRLYCGDGGGMLPLVYQAVLRFLAPVTPVLVEEAWGHTPAWLKDR
jgi:isoleucyl-tRNA synthetase